ncbi:MAG: GtrA family protein [Chloroflexi bacterium]|nr:GtrA family protein [Chloroflexota bacterium]
MSSDIRHREEKEVQEQKMLKAVGLEEAYNRLVSWLPASLRQGEMKRFVKFATVGAVGMVVDLSILNLLHGLLGLHLLVANTISFSAAVISNFTWNRLWTFPEKRDQPMFKQLFQFAVVSVVGLLINNFILWKMYHVLAPHLAPPWDYNAAKIFAIGVVLFWNFGANRLWTFR